MTISNTLTHDDDVLAYAEAGFPPLPSGRHAIPVFSEMDYDRGQSRNLFSIFRKKGRHRGNS